MAARGMKTRVYRRKRGWKHESWHFCKTCHRWPHGGDFEETRHEPWHSLCRECQRLEKENRCASGIRWL